MRNIVLFILWSYIVCGKLVTDEHSTGPPGAKLRYDLLSNSEPGIEYPEDHLGAFVPVLRRDGSGGNFPVPEFDPWACQQDNLTNTITITAQWEDDRVSTGRLNTYGVWSTALAEDIKMHGYLEVESTLPAKQDGDNFRSSWPGIWLLGPGNGAGWPNYGEIDIACAYDGYPQIFMELHSTNHHSGAAQRPPGSPIDLEADLSVDPITAGLEWEISEKEGNIKLTWWIKWFDQASETWTNLNTTKSLFGEGNDDYFIFLNSFLSEGFSLIIDLPEGGSLFPGPVLPGHQPQYMEIFNVKVFGF